MSQWKLGYIANLDDAVSENAGKALYDGFGSVVLSFDSKEMYRSYGTIEGRTELTLTDIDEFIGTNIYSRGILRIVNGTAKGNNYRVESNTDDVLTMISGTTLVTDGVSIGDFYEVKTGASTFTFPTQRNPIRLDYRRTIKSKSMRFPFYEGGINVPIGKEADDMPILVYLTSESEFKKLELLLNSVLDYQGMDAYYSGKEAAPMILQEGSATVDNQHLVWVESYKLIRDGKRGSQFWEVMITFKSYSNVGFKGI